MIIEIQLEHGKITIDENDWEMANSSKANYKFYFLQVSQAISLKRIADSLEALKTKSLYRIDVTGGGGRP